jgi:hypothetical protein
MTKAAEFTGNYRLYMTGNNSLEINEEEYKVIKKGINAGSTYTTINYTQSGASRVFNHSHIIMIEPLFK